MAHGGQSSTGKYYNQCTDAEVNKGCYGKLSSAQISERIELHARRLIEGRPTVAAIATHWYEKYKIEMSYQSEKQWCRTKANAGLIKAKMEELQKGGVLAIPELDTQTLLSSLTKSAMDNADNCGEIKKRLNDAINLECTPWALAGLTQEEYFNLKGPKRKEADALAKIQLTARKDSAQLAFQYGRAYITASKEFRDSVKQTYEMGKYLKLIDSKVNRSQVRNAKNTEITDVTHEENVSASTELSEEEIEAARKSLYEKDN